MRARECASRATRIAAEVLGHKEFVVECPPHLRRKGIKGDQPHYGRIIIVKVGADSSLDYDLLEKLSKRITESIEDVNALVLDITSVASLDKAAVDNAWAQFAAQQAQRREKDLRRRRALTEKAT